MRGTTRCHKTVHFFLLRPVGGALDQLDAEFDEASWLDLPEALALMSHATERSVVEEASRLLGASAASGPMAGAEATA